MDGQPRRGQSLADRSVVQAEDDLQQSDMGATTHGEGKGVGLAGAAPVLPPVPVEMLRNTQVSL